MFISGSRSASILTTGQLFWLLIESGAAMDVTDIASKTNAKRSLVTIITLFKYDATKVRISKGLTNEMTIKTCFNSRFSKIDSRYTYYILYLWAKIIVTNN
jgi:hypothetical protein